MQCSGVECIRIPAKLGGRVAFSDPLLTVSLPFGGPNGTQQSLNSYRDGWEPQVRCVFFHGKTTASIILPVASMEKTVNGTTQFCSFPKVGESVPDRWIVCQDGLELRSASRDAPKAPCRGRSVRLYVCGIQARAAVMTGLLFLGVLICLWCFQFHPTPSFQLLCLRGIGLVLVPSSFRSGNWTHVADRLTAAQPSFDSPSRRCCD